MACVVEVSSMSRSSAMSIPASSCVVFGGFPDSECDALFEAVVNSVVCPYSDELSFA